MDEHELGALVRGALEELEPGGHAGDDRRDRFGPRDLEAVGAVVGERRGVEQLVEVGEQGVAVSHRLIVNRMTG